MTFSTATGDLTFDSPASYSVSGWLNGVSVADLNGDGQPDVITTNTFEHEICVLLNKGSGQLGPVVRYAVEAAPYSIAVADLNSDHSADVVVANNGIAGTGGSVTVAFGNGDGSLRAYGEFDYKPSANWIFSAMYDYWGGSAHNPTARWGPFTSFDQLVIDVGYTF